MDNGILLAQNKDEHGTLQKWLECKLSIYEKMQNTSLIIDTCKQLFITKDGDIEYYYKLKRLIPENEGKSFLFTMM
ncbi:hypothetical protein [Jilunia laotingensis]|uniref:hypothetical protein n=1 Tax=Jilunia laotingensis TaxID=2763675 RepID=UPI00223B5BEE|nr:hypothetical protein [Jilunia laotingensis]